MALSGVSGVPEQPQKPQKAVSGNQFSENDAVSIFNFLDTDYNEVIDENDKIDRHLLSALQKRFGNKLTLKKVADKLSDFTYTKTDGNDNIVYNIQGQAIRTGNTKFDEKGNITSDKIEEYIFVKDNGNDLKVKINIDKKACANKRAYESLIKQLVSDVSTLSPQARADLVNEVDGIKVEFTAFQNNPAGRFVTGENIIELYVNGNGSTSKPGVDSLPQIMPNTISHELGHAIDEHKGEFRLSQQINTKDIRKSLYNKIDFEQYSESQRYFLFGSEDEFAAEYYAYKYGGSPNASRFALMRAVEKLGNQKFAEAAKACEKIWAEARQNVEQQKTEKNLYKIEELHKLKGDAVSQYQNDFYAVSDVLAPDADEFLTNTQILQQYYSYKTGKCDEATAQKFKSMKDSGNASLRTLEPIFLKEFKRLGIEI